MNEGIVEIVQVPVVSKGKNSWAKCLRLVQADVSDPPAENAEKTLVDEEYLGELYGMTMLWS